jgi:hypothetical protein
MLGSVAVLALGYRRLLVIINTGFALLGSNVLLFFAALTTGLVVGGANTINDFGSAFQLQVKQGGPFLAMAWVAAVLAMGVSTFWFVIWFVEGRRHGYKRRARTSQQIGNYKGIVKEVREDWRVEKSDYPVPAVKERSGAVRESPSMEAAT